ncbi:MAG: right-handed parallel beta-helix repeat-containing protein [Actinomycetota bacterium]
MRTLRALVALTLISSLAGVAPADAQLSPYVIRVTNGRFEPPTLSVPVGAEVTWVVEESGHTVSASDYRFDWEPNRTLTRGETRSWTFTQDETVRYICRVHAPGMSGVITVGEGSPPPPPPPPISGETRSVPSTEYPTIDAALIDIPPDSEIVLQAGIYAPFVVPVDEVLIRSVTTPDEVVVDGSVVVDGQGIVKNGIRIAADKVRIRGLTVRRVAERAVWVQGDDAELSFVALDSGLTSAVTVAGGSRVKVSDSQVTGSPAAPGIELLGGTDALVQRLTISGARSGLDVRGTDGVVIRDSTFSGNGTGIALRSSLQDRILGVHAFANTINATNAPPNGLSVDLDPVTGAGIWADGAWGARFERNTISGSLTYAIAVTAISYPTLGVQISGNSLGSSRIADIGWDGVGTLCATQQGTYDPPTGFAGCDHGPSIGLPWPKVTAELLAYAAFGQII